MKQGFEDMKVVSDVNAKVNSDTEEMEMTSSTPGFLEENLVVEIMGTMSIIELDIPVIKKTYARVRNVETIKWRPKTIPRNKLQLNMKKLINPRLQEENMIEIE